MNFRNIRGKERMIIAGVLEVIILITAVYCIFSLAGRVSEKRETRKNEGTDIQELRADLGRWNLILVNRWEPIPEDFSVTTADIEDGYSIDRRVKKNLEQMLSDCRDAGCSPLICSAFRTHETQQSLYDQEAEPYLEQGMDEAEAYEKAGESVAVPGTSEHECGLAVDIIDESYQMLDDEQEKTATQKWLMTHCQDYGFILRYPNEKKEITGIIYEPWHYRYVGEKHARYIMEKGICFEEYTELLSGQKD